MEHERFKPLLTLLSIVTRIIIGAGAVLLVTLMASLFFSPAERARILAIPAAVFFICIGIVICIGAYTLILESMVKKRGYVIIDLFNMLAIRIVASIFGVALFLALGIVFKSHINDTLKSLIAGAAYILVALFAILIAVNILSAKKYNQSKHFDARQAQEFYLERREQAIKDLPRVTRKITRLRKSINIYSVLLFVACIFTALASGILGFGIISAVLVLFSAYFAFGILLRIKPIGNKTNVNEYSKKSDYPYIYGLAEKAATDLGIKGRIRIIFTLSFNAAISKSGRNYTLMIGTELLNAATDDELYQILIHEFAHTTKDGNPEEKEFRLYGLITDRYRNKFVFLANALFALPDSIYTFEYSLYRAVSSVAKESAADKAINKHGTAQIAANALAKLFYLESFARESKCLIKESIFKHKEFTKHYTQMLSDEFRKAVALRGEFWKELIFKEIQPRNATHPITRKRIEDLGIDDFEVCFENRSDSLIGECKKATLDVDTRFYEYNKERHAEASEHFLAIYDKWAESGKRVAAEQARPIIDTLFSLCCFDELESLCDDIIANTENRQATAHAHRTKAVILLSRYDKKGIEHFYTAVDINKNYVEEAIDMIGLYCCLCGWQDELDIYRQKALEWQQNNIDEYSHTATLNHETDKITADDIPEETRKSIVDFIKSIDENQISRVYLVQKQVNDSFATNAVILRFKPAVHHKIAERICDKLYDFLDTHPSGIQFSLFVYNNSLAPVINSVENCCIYDAAFDK